MIINKIAMIVGYITIACLWYILMVIVFAKIAKHLSERNEKIYRKEYKKRYDNALNEFRKRYCVDSHIDINDGL